MKKMWVVLMAEICVLVNTSASAEVNGSVHSQSVRFQPKSRAVGDVMPFYHNGEYHLFYLLNASGNNDVNWEHAVSRDLVNWTNLPAAILRDPKDQTGPEGGCMFTGSIIENEGLFHAYYTSWNPDNPAGREFICHATSKDLVNWTKHPEDMFGPDGIHYANHHDRDFRDPCVIWDGEQKIFKMFVNANEPDKPGFVFGVLTSSDLKTWKQNACIQGIPGDECPDFFKSGNTYYLHGCNVYAYATNKNGAWKFPAYNRLDRRMAAKRVFDGKRNVWFGGWLGGPMSIPREVGEGPDGLLYMKPVEEIVNAFSTLQLSVSNLTLTDGKIWKKNVPQNYMLTANLDLSQGQELWFTIRSNESNDASHIVLSAGEKLLKTGQGEHWESRPLPIDFTRPVTVQAFILGAVAEVFVNSQFAATFFINSTGGTLSLESKGKASIRNLEVTTTSNDGQGQH